MNPQPSIDAVRDVLVVGSGAMGTQIGAVFALAGYTVTTSDLDPAALDAARTIPAQMPGVCIVAGQDGTWHRARSVYVPEHEAEHAAHTYAHLTPSWADLTSSLPAVRPAVA